MLSTLYYLVLLCVLVSFLIVTILYLVQEQQVEKVEQRVLISKLLLLEISVSSSKQPSFPVFFRVFFKLLAVLVLM